MKNFKRLEYVGYTIVCMIIFSVCVYNVLFYPKQSMSNGEFVVVLTPDSSKYYNDCLHPCIRHLLNGKFVMVQSPWYGCTDGIENPILYISDNPMNWCNGLVVEDTPEKGYNSDPNVYVEGNRIYVFWREAETPLCEQLGVRFATVGVYTDDEGKSFSEKKVYLTCSDKKIDTEMCPILMKKDEIYRFYATWYQTWRQDRHNLGVAIWEGTNLENPDFQLTKTVPFRTKYICDKFRQREVYNYMIYLPKPHKFDLWHFDLFENEGTLYMVASEEMEYNVCLAISKDWEHFELDRTPLINSYANRNNCTYCQYYYKPTALVINDSLHLFYTANSQDDYKHNILFHSSTPVKKINH